MDEVKEYMRWRKLPRELVLRMRRYYTYYYSRKTAFNEAQILGALTPGLRFEVIEHTLKETIGKIPLFAKTLDPLFQMEVFPLLKPMAAVVLSTQGADHPCHGSHVGEQLGRLGQLGPWRQSNGPVGHYLVAVEWYANGKSETAEPPGCLGWQWGWPCVFPGRLGGRWEHVGRAVYWNILAASVGGGCTIGLET